MENKMYTKPQYKCAICGEIYEDLNERINCETACLKKQEEAAKKAAEAKKNAEQKARHEAVNKLIEDAVAAITAYTDDYGSYEYNGKLIDELELPDLLKMLHYFMF